MTLLLVLQLSALFLPAMPPPPPSPAIFQQPAVDDPLETDGPNWDPARGFGHGAYEHARGWTCSKVETNEAVKNVQCFCKEACENGGSEDHSCMTSCANPKKCYCHEDSSACPGPEVLPKPKPKKGKR